MDNGSSSAWSPKENGYKAKEVFHEAHPALAAHPEVLDKEEIDQLRLASTDELKKELQRTYDLLAKEKRKRGMRLKAHIDSLEENSRLKSEMESRDAEWRQTVEALEEMMREKDEAWMEVQQLRQELQVCQEVLLEKEEEEERKRENVAEGKFCTTESQDEDMEQDVKEETLMVEDMRDTEKENMEEIMRYVREENPMEEKGNMKEIEKVEEQDNGLKEEMMVEDKKEMTKMKEKDDVGEENFTLTDQRDTEEKVKEIEMKEEIEKVKLRNKNAKKRKNLKRAKKSVGASTVDCNPPPPTPPSGQNGHPKEKGETGEEKSQVDTNVEVSNFDLRVGRIISAEKHPNADSLYVELVDVGEASPRTAVSNLVQHGPLDQLQNRMVVLLCNLRPAKIRGVQSQSMIVCASTPEKVELLDPPRGAVPGHRVTVQGFPDEPEQRIYTKKLWEQVQQDIFTDGQCVATYKGAAFEVGGLGVCRAQSLSYSRVR